MSRCAARSMHRRCRPTLGDRERTLPTVLRLLDPASPVRRWRYAPVLTVRLPATYEHEPSRSQLDERIDGYFVARERRSVEHGPFVAVGGIVGQGALVQAGYDISWPHGRGSWSTGLAFDVAPQERVTITPVFEFVAPFKTGMFTPPSITAGLGVPVDVWPSPTPGVRVQVSLYVPFFSLAAYVDLMPLTRDARIAVLARLSL